MKILVIHYSQTGQLTQILTNISDTLQQNEMSVDFVRCQTDPTYDFPWSQDRFYDAMPESVLYKGCSILPFELQETKYDLVIFGYQPWYLSPSIPAMGILKNDTFKSIIKDTPVITVIGARNMWINAQDEVASRLKKAGGKLVGNIPLIDKHQNLLSAVAIVHWMLSGKKERKWNVFPPPGIAQQDIDESGIFGEVIANNLKTSTLDTLQKEILATHKIGVKWSIIFIEGRAKKLFKIWANLVISKGTTPEKRKKWLNYYRIYLLFVLFIVSPILLTFVYIFIRPFQKKDKHKDILSV